LPSDSEPASTVGSREPTPTLAVSESSPASRPWTR
jgi:hypothetical protein